MEKAVGRNYYSFPSLQLELLFNLWFCIIKMQSAVQILHISQKKKKSYESVVANIYKIANEAVTNSNS